MAGDAMKPLCCDVLMRERKEKVMKAEDKKLIEEVEELDAKATPGPWEPDLNDEDGYTEIWSDRAEMMVAKACSDDEAHFIARARELLPKLAARLKTLLDDAPPPSPKLPEPLVDGFYWLRCGEGEPEIGERRGDIWWLTGDDCSYTRGDNIEPLLGPLLPPLTENVTK
jgi:hypothetical protein